MKFFIAFLALVAAAAADVSHLVNNEYLPPVHGDVAPLAPGVPAVSDEYLPPVSVGEVEPAHELNDDGYVYKNPVEERRRARRRYRLRYRHRRY